MYSKNVTQNQILENATIRLDGDSGDIMLKNADCAEEIEIDDIDAVEPGTVAVIENENRLKTGNQEYDKRVAGVISCAGQFKPGIILDKRYDSKNKVPLALMGKVFCKVDADYVPIQVGNILTTSLTPGYAMKAFEPMKSVGTVIGKALRKLNSGKGLIPFLVTLQ